MVNGTATTSGRNAIIALSSALWLLNLWVLAPDWNLYPQYGYGWFVIPLAAYLFWRQWEIRPVPQPEPAGRRIWLATAVCILVLALARPINSSNPDWRLAKWAIAASVIAITLQALWMAGGRSWLKHFIWPVLFTATALPWAKPLEDALTQRLMPIVANIAVDVLWLAKVPALQQGNLIQVPTALIGVDEACSGIRSLQGTIMAAAFLGALFRLVWWRWSVLFVSGVVLAFVLNVVRAIILALVAAKSGSESFGKWHDTAGLSILLVVVAGLWLIALRLKRGQSLAEGLHEAEIVALTGNTTSAAPAKPGQPLAEAFLISSKWTVTCLVALISIEAAKECWFQFHARGKHYKTLWTADWSKIGSTPKKDAFQAATTEILGYDQGEAFFWNGPDLMSWFAYDFHWKAGNDHIRDVQYHRPDVCLPASGRTLRGDLGIRQAVIKGQNIFYRQFVFEDAGRPLHVFQVTTEDQLGAEETGLVMEENSRTARFQRFLDGKRDYPARRVINFYVRGIESPGEARIAAENVLQRIVVPTGS